MAEDTSDAALVGLRFSYTGAVSRPVSADDLSADDPRRSTLFGQASGSSATWVDDRPVDPTWFPPTDVAAFAIPSGRPLRRRRPSVWVVLLLVLALAAGAVVALGGFRRRTDLVTPVPLGARVDTGALVFTFTSATAQREKLYDGTIDWVVTVLGTGRTTQDSTTSPDIGEGGIFGARDPHTLEIQLPDDQRFGRSADPIIAPQAFVPGLPDLQYRIGFKFSAHYAPGATLEFVVARQNFGVNDVFGLDPPSWYATDRGFKYLLPVTVLPPST